MKTKSSKSPIYEGPFEYLGGVLQRIGTEEGQLIRDASGNYTAQYYLKDQRDVAPFGSVRQVIRETGTVLQETERPDVSVLPFWFANSKKRRSG